MSCMTAVHECMYNKTIITFSFCDIQNNQGLGKPKASPDNHYLDPDYNSYNH